MERVRDFIILHYWANKRGDTVFWRDCNAVTLPDTLQRKVDLWTRRGHFIRYRWEMFHPASWLAIYAGFELLPETIDPSLDGIDPQTLSAPLAEMRKAIAEVVASAPPHGVFLEQYCRPVAMAAQ
jgi:tryptophan halogenase